MLQGDRGGHACPPLHFNDMKLDILDLGLIEYERAWKLQDEYAAEIAEGRRSPTLLLLEHPHTFTFGRKGHAENLLWSPDELRRRGVSVHWVDRGGDVTYHGPGQLVGYPLIPLEPLSPDRFLSRSSGLEDSVEKPVRFPSVDYVGYVRRLEGTLISVLAVFGVPAIQRAGLTGVWVPAETWSRSPRCCPEERDKPAKIAAIGVKVDARGVTRHGFALNVNPDMEYWEGIVACGLADDPVAALADLVSPIPTMEQVRKETADVFRTWFRVDGTNQA
jgi:lipoyl(octanoyl) transferase